MTRQAMKLEDIVAQKRERVPVHESKEKLSTKGLDHANYYYRYVKINDADRVQKFLDAGYQFVRKNGSAIGDSTVETSRGTDSLMSVSGGKGAQLALMALPRELWNKDQADKEKRIRELESSIKQGLVAQADPRVRGTGVELFGSEGNSTPNR